MEAVVTRGFGGAEGHGCGGLWGLGGGPQASALLSSSRDSRCVDVAASREASEGVFAEFGD